MDATTYNYDTIRKRKRHNTDNTLHTDSNTNNNNYIIPPVSSTTYDNNIKGNHSICNIQLFYRQSAIHEHAFLQRWCILDKNMIAIIAHYCTANQMLSILQHINHHWNAAVNNKYAWKYSSLTMKNTVVLRALQLFT